MLVRGDLLGASRARDERGARLQRPSQREEGGGLGRQRGEVGASRGGGDERELADLPPEVAVRLEGDAVGGAERSELGALQERVELDLSTAGASTAISGRSCRGLKFDTPIARTRPSRFISTSARHASSRTAAWRPSSSAYPAVVIGQCNKYKSR